MRLDRFENVLEVRVVHRNSTQLGIKSRFD